MPPWTEMGTGHYGSLMTQNYGQAPKWSKEAPAKEAEVPTNGESVPWEEGGAMGEEGATPDGPDYEEED